MILQSLLFLPLLVYAFYILRYWLAWNNIPCIINSSEADQAFFTVIVPVRNEASTIVELLSDLEKQRYPKSGFEVLVVDDHSEDNTPQLVEQYQQRSELNIRLLFLASFPEKRQKKAAIETGVAAAQGEWIACTDGDCRVNPDWLLTLNQVRHQLNPKLISGPVILSPAKNTFERLQVLEFSALIGVGAATIQLGQATMCNGANIAYERAAFYAVNGFAGNEQIASGDDEFLLHKIHRVFPGQIAFAKSEEAVVSTRPTASLSKLLQQRVRWASKWSHYDSKLSRLLAVLVVGANAIVFCSFLGAVFQWLCWGYFLAVLLLKLLPDLILLGAVLGFFRKKRLLSYIVLLQFVYFPYVLLTAVLGLKGSYNWKGRNHSTP